MSAKSQRERIKDKPRVVIMLESFLQHSQTYVKTEIEALQRNYRVKIIALHKPESPCPNNFDYRYREDFESDMEMLEYVREFSPHVIHAHYWFMAKHAHLFAKELGIPFTVRTHSFDVIKPPRPLGEVVALINSEYCLRVLAFPFLVDKLVDNGADKDKVVACYPAIKYSIFHDTSPNGKAVMNTGACLPKKSMESFIDIAAKVSDKRFNLYPIGYRTDKLKQYNSSKNNVVHFNDVLLPDEMPPEYKKHEWLVYTANKDRFDVGWPMAIAEAQASGVGVLMPSIREDLDQYIGGAGYIFSSIDEAAEIVSGSYPQEMRERGFENAKKSDIDSHLHLLTDVWEDFLKSSASFELEAGNLSSRHSEQEDSEIGNLMNQAVSLHHRGKGTQARQLCNQVLSMDPARPGALRMLGVILSEDGQTDEALELIQQSLSIRPGNAVAWLDLGNIYKNTGDYQRALDACRRSIEINPEIPLAYQYMGQIYRQLGDIELAVDNYEKALALSKL